jgi:hypothetical protein
MASWLDGSPGKSVRLLLFLDGDDRGMLAACVSFSSLMTLFGVHRTCYVRLARGKKGYMQLRECVGSGRGGGGACNRRTVLCMQERKGGSPLWHKP